MELKRTRTVRSPTARDRVRLVGEVAYDDASLRPEHYWFEIPERYAQFLTTSGNPWLICLLPLAATLGEPLRVSRPVHPVVIENAQKLMLVWKRWYPQLSVVPLEADAMDRDEDCNPTRTALFFSGGVDSFFTLLHHDSQPGGRGPTKINDLLWVFGFDVRLDNPRATERRRTALKAVAADLGKEFVDITANLRDTAFRRARWALLSCACALAGVALALERRYATVLISSSHYRQDLKPCGSHPTTDPLLSTARTRFVHYGADFRRVQKAALLVESEVAMHSLYSCYRDPDGGNCGSCAKCLMTMAALELVGGRERCTTFREESWRPERFARIFRPANGRAYLRELQRFAQVQARSDIARAIGRGFRRSDRLDRMSRVAERVDDWLASRPPLRGWSGSAKRLILRNAIL